MIEDNDFICYNYTCLLFLAVLRTHTQIKGYEYDIYQQPKNCQYFKKKRVLVTVYGNIDLVAPNASYLDVFFMLIFG